MSEIYTEASRRIATGSSISTTPINATLAARRAVLAKRLQQLKADQDHWNRMHPDEEPISLDFDLTADVEAALAAKRGTP
ncbi:MAG: hypothetical protein WC551_07555 [Patescibacteria group bacterium]